MEHLSITAKKVRHEL